MVVLFAFAGGDIDQHRNIRRYFGRRGSGRETTD
jgi:hypothetical protein